MCSQCLVQVVVVKSDEQGNVDLKDLAEKAEKHKVRTWYMYRVIILSVGMCCPAAAATVAGTRCMHN